MAFVLSHKGVTCIRNRLPCILQLSSSLQLIRFEPTQALIGGALELIQNTATALQDKAPWIQQPTKVMQVALDRRCLQVGTGTGTGTGNGTGGSGTKSYEELARQDSRLFTGKDFDVRLCTDAVDSLFPNGITGAIEPTWPAPYSSSIKTGMVCASFGPERYTWYSEHYQTCGANYREADYEAVGRRGYEEKMALASLNLAIGYNTRKNADPNNPGQVCKQGGF